MAEPVAPCASQLTNDESHESLLDQILAMPLGAPRATTSTALDLGDPLNEESLLMSVLIETKQQRREAVVGRPRKFSLKPDFSGMEVALPPGYKLSDLMRTPEQQAQISAMIAELTIIRAQLKQLRSLVTFKEKLELLAKLYDQENNIVKKAAIMAQIMSIFSMPEERYYMSLIAAGPWSAHFKRTLYEHLTVKFKSDPTTSTWQRDLETAMRQAGL